MGRAQKNLAHKLAAKNPKNPLRYKRIPFERVKNITPKKQSDTYMVSKKKKGTVIGVGVGY